MHFLPAKDTAVNLNAYLSYLYLLTYLSDVLYEAQQETTQ